MKFFVLSILVFSAVISCKAAPNTSGEFVSESDIAKKAIAETLQAIEKLSDNNKVAKAVVKSIDQKCMLETYQKKKLMSDLTEESLDLGGFSETTPVDSYIVFVNIAFLCSSKLDGLLGFFFDNLFSYSGLLDTFREDELLKEFFDDLKCLNNYAVSSNLLDPQDFSLLKHELVNQTQEDCDKRVEELKKALTDALDFGAGFIITDHARCLKTELAAGAEKFFLKYFLLIPLSLSEDQRKAQKLNFIADSRQGLENILLCNIEKKTTTDNDISD